MKKKSFPLIFKELPGTKIKKKNSVKLQALNHVVPTNL